MYEYDHIIVIRRYVYNTSKIIFITGFITVFGDFQVRIC